VLLENNSNPDLQSGKWLSSAIYGTKVGVAVKGRRNAGKWRKSPRFCELLSPAIE